ncbi:MAG TPA: dihydrodipicolinate synthase family protein [Bryobacteraceae bacterium]|nr:dihydrodipicolinate synthase family protein [Bryobacteraceae bacterium]
MRNGLEGIIVAAVTPRQTQQHCIDLGATLELVDFLGHSGVAGIALLGSTGEFVHFALEDRRHMVNLAAKRSRVPLLVNVSHSTLDGAIELARAAANAGVDGVMVMPPYYFRQSQESIRSFYRTFATEVGEATPIYLYNIPACTTGIDSEVATDLLSTGLFAGIKDSSGNLDYFRTLAQQNGKTPFTLFAGHERIYRQCKEMGAKGIVSGVASALPELMVAFDRALSAGSEEESTRLEALLAEFLERVEIFLWPAGVKQAAKQRKLKIGALAAPLGPEGERRLTEFGEWFDGWLPGVLRECGR